MTVTIQAAYAAADRYVRKHKYANLRDTAAAIKAALGYDTLPRGTGPIVDAAARAATATRAAQSPPRDINARLDDYRVEKFVAEIVRRDAGPVSIREEKGDVHLQIVHSHAGLYLLGAEGWQYYGRRHKQRYRQIAYLCGRDDNGVFARRVPGTCETVRGAIAALEPAEVSRAKREGRRVWRQGDLYAVEMTRDRADDSYSALPFAVRQSHIWNPTGRTLRHTDGHAHIRFGKRPIKFVLQNVGAAFNGGRDYD